MVIRVLHTRGLPGSPGGVYREEQTSGCLQSCLGCSGAVVVLVLLVFAFAVWRMPHFGGQTASRSAYPGRISPSVSRAEADAARRDAAELAALTVAVDGDLDGEDSVHDNCQLARPADYGYREGLIDCSHRTQRDIEVAGDPHSASLALDHILRSRGWHLQELRPAAGDGLPAGIEFGELIATNTHHVSLVATWHPGPLRLSVSVNDPYWKGVPADT